MFPEHLWSEEQLQQELGQFSSAAFCQVARFGHGCIVLPKDRHCSDLKSVVSFQMGMEGMGI